MTCFSLRGVSHVEGGRTAPHGGTQGVRTGVTESVDPHALHGFEPTSPQGRVPPYARSGSDQYEAEWGQREEVAVGGMARGTASLY